MDLVSLDVSFGTSVRVAMCGKPRLKEFAIPGTSNGGTVCFTFSAINMAAGATIPNVRDSCNACASSGGRAPLTESVTSPVRL